MAKCTEIGALVIDTVTNIAENRGLEYVVVTVHFVNLVTAAVKLLHRCSNDLLVIDCVVVYLLSRFGCLV